MIRRPVRFWEAWPFMKILRLDEKPRIASGADAPMENFFEE
jgi:hypothetical protein